jgi:hypothetical protein
MGFNMSTFEAEMDWLGMGTRRFGTGMLAAPRIQALAATRLCAIVDEFVAFEGDWHTIRR